jgi:alpha-galactosidase
MIKKLSGKQHAFLLQTENTSYIFEITHTGHPMHLYYGPKIAVESADELSAFHEKRMIEPGNTVLYAENKDDSQPKITLEDMCLEVSGFGKGDVREPFVELVRADGSRTTDFVYDGSLIDDVPPSLDGLPTSYDDSGKVEHLYLKLKDGPLVLQIHYYVYPECDVITRTARLVNNGERIELLRLMSAQLDFYESGYSLSVFRGAWGREMNRFTVPIIAGKFVNESRTGCSSNRANPFFMLHDADANEEHGSVYGFNLVYSGNHYSAAEVNAYGKTRIVTGIQPGGARFVLEKGEHFDAPEAVMTYSADGFRGQSVNMHRFVRKHIVRGEWRDKERPILLNSWEASYFNFTERSLISLAKAAKEMGVELFVLDDGWFGERNDDLRSLGDWDPNPKKLPNGLKGLAEKVNELGLQFGVWIEPEMVNVDSDLYRAHPDWAMAIPGRPHSEQRHQRILDLSNPAVVDYMINKICSVLGKANIAYVKWDMNRIFSDAYSPYLPAERQGEVPHRYILGLYRLAKGLTEHFPHVLFEGCASGGNRFDLGALCYFPQIWGSDNSDAMSRTKIQEGYSYAYPLTCVGAHVSDCPNHQTLRTTPLQTRFNVAAFGALGYELNVKDMDKDSKENMRAQILLYTVWREVFQLGQFYRGRTGNVHEWTVVSQSKDRAVGMIMQEMTVPNSQYEYYKPVGLDPDRTYRLYNISGRVNVKLFGSLINIIAPIHIKQNTFVHDIAARLVKIGEEKEDYTAKGSVLMQGVKLSQAFNGGGYGESVRVFTDYSSRMYFIVAADE